MGVDRPLAFPMDDKYAKAAMVLSRTRVDGFGIYFPTLSSVSVVSPFKRAERMARAAKSGILRSPLITRIVES